MRFINTLGGERDQGHTVETNLMDLSLRFTVALWHYGKGLIIPGESTGGWRLTVETRERTLPGLLSAALHLYSPEDLLGENKNGKMLFKHFF